ncbi:GerAB/ArcD/ProY family transporter [Longirhabdus pacifica]|uniref:GerAB/ArcD/ProY family transporter n=1 Tax=Longirhabdus pacifica TaxID=2305227 RepID=UPI0010089E29|nr:endospore germination permease [Longirhabdus pacifica]
MIVNNSSTYRKTEIISSRQFAWMTIILILGGGNFIPTVNYNIVMQDTWLTQISGFIYVILIALFFSFLAQKYPQKNIFNIIFEVTGSFWGSILNSILILFFTSIFLREMYSTGIYFQSTVLLNTPIEVLVFITAILIIYFGHMSFENVMRCNEMYAPFAILTSLLLPILLFNEFSFDLLRPVLATDAVDFLRSSVINMGLYGDLIVLGAFLHMLGPPEKIHSSIRSGGIFGIAVLILLIVVVTAVFGYVMATRLSLSYYAAIQLIHVSDFFDRLDIVIYSTWLPSNILKIIFIYFAILYGIGSFTKQEIRPVLNRGIGLMLFFISIIAYDSVLEVYNLAVFGGVFHVVFVHGVVVIPLLIILLLKAKKAKKKKTKQKKQHATYTKWVWMTNSLIFLCLVFLGIGFIWAERYYFVGIICGVCFVLTVILSTYTSWMETKKTPQQKKV